MRFAVIALFFAASSAIAGPATPLKASPAPAVPASSAQAAISADRQVRQDKRLACSREAAPRKGKSRRAFIKECVTPKT